MVYSNIAQTGEAITDGIGSKLAKIPYRQFPLRELVNHVDGTHTNSSFNHTLLSDALLVWIDLPRRHLNIKHVDRVFERLCALSDPHPIVITSTRVKNRYSRQSEFAKALQLFKRTTHCPCRYRESKHGSVDIYTRHVHTRAQCCKRAFDFENLEHPAAIELWCWFVEKWSNTWLISISQEQGYASYSDSDTSGEWLRTDNKKLSKSREQSHFQTESGTRSRTDASVRAQQIPDSPSLGVAQSTPLMSSSSSSQVSLGVSSEARSCDQTHYQYYLHDTKVMCLFLAADAATPVCIAPLTFDIAVLSNQTIPAGQGKLALTGLAFNIPKGMTGIITQSPECDISSFLSVVPGIIDHTSQRELGILLHNNGTQAYTFDNPHVVARVFFESPFSNPSDFSAAQIASAAIRALPSYPTNEKVAQQEARRKAKEAGIELEVKKRPKFVQNHFDDCGEDLRSLGVTLDHDGTNCIPAATEPEDYWVDALFAEDSDSDDEGTPHMCDYLENIIGYGPLTDQHFYLANLQVYVAKDIDELILVANTKGRGVDIAEICGGEARASQLTVRRSFRVGPNFDLVTQCDLSKPKDAESCYQYFVTCTVLVAVMAPCCDCYGPISHLNWSINYNTMLEKYKNGRPIALLTGKIAKLQLTKGLDFLQEQPFPSDIYTEGDWPEVLAQPNVEQVKYDRCCKGLRVSHGPHKGLYIKKPSSMTVSCAELGNPFRNSLCKGHHQHLSGDGHGRELRESQIWTWREAQCVVDGIAEVKRRHKHGARITAYPAVDRSTIARATPGGAPGGPRDSRAPPAPTSPCPGCKGRMARDDIHHNRKVGECAYPYDEPTIWGCDACLKRVPRLHASHTQKFGECQWAVKPVRAGSARKGAHPRDPAQPASDDPTQGIQGTFTPDQEAAIDAISDDMLKQIEELDMKDTTVGTGSSSSSSSSTARQPRGPDIVQRTRSEAVKSKDAGTGDNTTDWTNFDVARSMRTLRLGTDSQQRLTIRKLHLRWWHASASAMYRLLERAGCPESALQKIKAICDTCTACRAWAKPQPESITSVDLADEFNKQVEYDIVFIYKFAIFHLVDRCTRWQEATIVDHKDEHHLVDAIDAWVSRHGPMKELIGDGESGIVRSEYCKEYLDRKGIKLSPRAKDQHARIVERRGALLRDCIHRIDAQCQLEGMNHIPFKHRLSEAVFCLNALLSINNTTPFNAVYGRSPKILPDINCPDASHEEDAPAPGLIRHTNRLREIAVQNIVDGTARARLGRALTTKTLPVGEREGYTPGEEVDIYRTGAKDIPGWHGPCTVADVTRIPRGIIGVRDNHHLKDVKVGDVRRHLAFLCFLATSVFAGTASHVSGPGWQQARQIAEELAVGQTLLLGWILSSNVWHVTKDTRKFPRLFNILFHFGRNHLRLEDLYTIRVGHGVGTTGKLQGYAEGIVLWWAGGCTGVQTIEQEANDGELPSISWQSLTPDSWRQIRFIQFARTEEESLLKIDPERADASDVPMTTPPGSSADSRLSTIPEEHSSDLSQADTFFQSPDFGLALDDPFLAKLGEVRQEAFLGCLLDDDAPVRDTTLDVPFTNTFSHSMQFTESTSDTIPYVPPIEPHEIASSTYHLTAANVRAGLSPNYRLEEEESFVELGYEDYTWRLIPDVPREPQYGETVVVRFYKSQSKASNTHRTVNVERDDDLLTPEETKTHYDEVRAAMLKELQTWAQHGCFSRRSREGARNIIDCRWVLKWKWDTDATGTAESAAGQQAKSRRVIRARLTVRGFKDCDKGLVATYAGTSQRFSQRILVSEAVIRGWDLATSDISKAFLQGVTYSELAALTGEKVREVNFYLPAYNIPQLRQVPGFENFNPESEVLHCDKPGTGSVDAPRCFSLKLSTVTTKCGLVASNVDPELCYLHRMIDGKLVLVVIMAKHVDDLKVTGERSEVIRIMQGIEAVFGKMKVSFNSFTNCGVRHIQDVASKEASLDQSEYIAGFKTIPPESYRGASSNSKCDPTLHLQYQSLLGAVAFTGLTRLDVIVFIVALQRFSHAPLVIHVKRLNALVKWMQANPRKLVYRRFKSGVSHLKIIADSSFKKEEEKGHSIRGVLHVRVDGTDLMSGGIAHILDFASKALRFVTRSTFSAELMGGCDSFDHALLVLFILNELMVGVPDKLHTRTLRECGGFAIPAALYIDALSVFAAVTATFIKPPAEKGLLAHVQYLRELLDCDLLDALLWLDTRDMTADGMTKGAVERDALHLLMSGQLEFTHPPKLWRPSCRSVKSAPSGA